MLLFDFRLTAYFSGDNFQVRPGLLKVCQRTFGDAGARFSSGRIPFLSPNQRCRSTERIYLNYIFELYISTTAGL